MKFSAIFLSTSVLLSSTQVSFAQSSHQDVVQAIKANIPAVRRIKDSSRREESLKTLGVSLAKLGELEQALTLAPDKATRDEVLREAARRQARLGNAPWALKTASRIQNQNSRLDALFAAARAHLRRYEYEAARRVLYRAVPLSRSSEYNKVLPYHAWLLSAAGDSAGAKRLFDAARRKKFVEEYEQRDADENIAYYLAKAGFYEDARTVANKQMWALFPIVRLVARRGDYPLAKKFAREFSTVELQARQLSEIAAIQAEAGRYNEAQQTAEEMSQLLPRLQQSQSSLPSHIMVALIYAMVGKFEESKQIYTEVKSSANFSPEVELIYALNVLLRPQIYRRLNAVQQQEIVDVALDAARRSKDAQYASNSLLYIAKIQKESGQDELAKQTLREAAQAARVRLTKEPDLNVSNNMLNAAALQREWGEINEAQEAVDFAISKLTKKSRTSVAFHLLGSGDYERSLKILFSGLGDDPSYYQTFALSYGKNQSVASSLQWISRLPKPEYRAFALSGLIQSLFPSNAEERELVLSENRYSSSRSELTQ